jgi:tight adherence protein B
MFGPTLTIVALAVLAMLFFGGLAYALMFSRVEAETNVTRRMEAVTDRTKAVTDRRASIDQTTRRKGIQDAMKELEAKQKALANKSTSPPLSLRLSQAGLKWSKKTFLLFSLACGLGFGIAAFLLKAHPLVALAAGGIGLLGFPRWFISFRRKRRMKQFTEELPNAVDVIVRGIKSGLPLGDCLRIIANESRDPVRSEFRAIIETQQLGVPIGDACQKLFERVPVQEANFFGIVIMIQQKAGGNLSETLGNLSKVLRERRKMRAKIAAVSMEAKASAGIIGSLPVIVTGIVYLTSPNYISILFTTTVGNVIIFGSLIYMFIGIMVMRKMINFEI